MSDAAIGIDGWSSRNLKAVGFLLSLWTREMRQSVGIVRQRT